MKSVMISIKPKWVEKICCGNKTIEVRKTRPKIDTPFKCYIYCSQQKPLLRQNIIDGKDIIANGKVIGEFVCDRVNMSLVGYKEHEPCYWDLLDGSCLSKDDIMNYGKWKPLYGWHISNLVIYDEPKELSEFSRECDYEKDCGDCPYLCVVNTPSCYETWCEVDEHIPLTRPPQSWCYVEEKA